MTALAGAAEAAGTRHRLSAAYQEACALELEALKPGNVHRGSAGHGMTVADFERSAAVSADPLTAPGLGLGERVYRAVAATREAVGCNTNLGIILLCAPLLQAALVPARAGSLHTRLTAVLRTAGLTDTAGLFRAIRLAAPGGLGTATRHDVAGPATATPLAVMAEAAHRDLIARTYVECFADLFERAVPLHARLRARWQDPAWAAAGLYLDFLGRFADTHIARKLGREQALAVTRRAAPLAAALVAAARPEPYRAALVALDREFKNAGRNPGTMADLTVAALLIPKLQALGDGLSPTANPRRPGRTAGSAATPLILF